MIKTYNKKTLSEIEGVSYWTIVVRIKKGDPRYVPISIDTYRSKTSKEGSMTRYIRIEDVLQFINK